MVLRKCTICDRRFKKTEHFKRHERSHTKERPYECNVCHKRFSRSDVLSRHAKGHNQGTAPNAAAKTKDAPTTEAHDRRQSAILGMSPMVPGPENGTQMLPNIGTEAHQFPPIMTPRDVNLSVTGIPPSSLDFLADISAHHSRTDPEMNTMMIDEQQPYFGWNEATPTAQSQRNNSLAFDAGSSDMLQMWLEPRTDAGSNHGSLDFTNGHLPLIGDNVVLTPDQQHRQSVDGAKPSGDNIPNERFAKVQRCWLAPPNHTGRIMNSLWRDVVYTDVDNVFSINSALSQNNVPLVQGSRCGIDEECRRRLQAVIGQTMFSFPHMQHPHNGAASPATTGSASNFFPQFPPAEILDMALDLYFRTFHPLVPFVHLPTFSAKTTRPLLLYVMCLIGMMLLGTKGTASFVSRDFSNMLERVTADLAKCTMGVESPSSTMSIFATAFLFLNLAVLTGDKTHLEQCQMLYVNLMSITQRHGLFAATEGQILDMSLFEAVPDIEMRWKAWSKVESTKRVIIGLLLLDSWYSSLLSTSPIIVPDSIQIIMPCNEALFRAHSSIRWTQLIRSGKRILMPTVLAPSENINIPAIEGPTDELSIQAVLAMVQLRQTEAYHRLLSNRASYPFAPCHTYAMDGRARCLPSLQFQIISNYREYMEKMNPNALVMWHHMCMMLTADIQIFEFAAGRAGPAPARKALDDIAEWSQTPAARRACLHAAHIYKSMTNRKASDHPTFHSILSLFSAALVLGLYTFMVPNSANVSSTIGSIELMDDIDWQQVGTEGFTSFMEPRGSQSFSPTEDPAVNFIRNGATIYLRGVPFQGGYQSARRILLDYAGLLKDSGKWSVKKFSYVLHIMSDVLMDVE
ncbi:transcriptional regulator family: C2H2 zinc finger and Fungal Specific TF [Penicillium cosmopolitanum]|uniref:Transcriptional regulator family: C2H2 zinc finger and Fungal Specific TF n=1 Tax=Penicillium cosmopolitanum TaxID=1131564 RepID=A0A9W9W4W0_9EURO|nr:transcriptional regulator family: C2H2 zinc finger and Fungal Specific TF [Penicillium cosmopolitanum]KAJ5403445.1 transcriptional regulator family: C2H2 zinc finger and Fungal Specific TF [Penicillium cosmopolitanum]